MTIRENLSNSAGLISTSKAQHEGRVRAIVEINPDELLKFSLAI